MNDDFGGLQTVIKFQFMQYFGENTYHTKLS